MNLDCLSGWGGGEVLGSGEGAESGGKSVC